METRATFVLVVMVSSLASVSSAQADLTVSFATDGPAPALSVSVASSEALREPEPTTPERRITPIAARFVRVGDGSGESSTFVLRDEQGEPGIEVLDRLSILVRPRDTDVPGMIASDDPDFVAPGIRRLHAGLLPLLARLAEHFPDRAIEIVSGYRPNAREGSRHRFGRALDLRVEGASIDEVQAFLDGEPFTGVGLYPTSGFVHLDVRTESVRWVDESGPGEAARVVRSEVVSRTREAPPEPPAPSPSDAEAIEAAMRAADAITLDFGLPD
jgi:hypothetical protein